ncbi:FecR domain-containing protein [Mangrovivirga sp. M17]|uniref:FecR domain-containing protein n=1 Tax=Mangrovivirga halotolerans TaxID=2993936 RepID=A0ABT3RS50_9BACT|nr:FecR domain-containing protein [Mangrovivirga halotolerans]MCX2744402.1 FecR domain-containing protein [Mangrovivirga halotolerans]
MKENYDDTFLARWLNNELTDEERKAFESSEEFKKYQKIIAATDNIEQEPFDEESALRNIKSRTNKFSVKPKNSQTYWWYGAAAAVAIFVFAFLFFYQPTTLVKTAHGEMDEVALPDGSLVRLNANSSLEFNESKWSENRVVQLNGEAFFDVEKGVKFSVNTSAGRVTVLGTEFNVTQLNGYLRVACYEGRVLVESGKEKTELSEGMVVQVVNDKIQYTETEESSPAWTTNNSEFNNTPVKYVFITLENQYGVKVDYSDLKQEMTFTGRFPNDDLKIALQIISGSLGLEYKQDGDKIIFKSNK